MTQMAESHSSCPAMPPVDGVLTMFYYEDLARAIDWYEHVIGFEKIMAFGELAIFAIHGGAHLALVGHGMGSQVPIRGNNKGAILSIQTRALQAWQERLFGHAAPGTDEGLHLGCDGRTREFKVRDPEGYIVEFFEWIE